MTTLVRTSASARRCSPATLKSSRTRSWGGVVCTRRTLVVASDASDDVQPALEDATTIGTDLGEVSTSASSATSVTSANNAVPYHKEVKAPKPASQPPISFLSVVLNTSFDKEIAKLALPALMTTLLDPVMTAIDAAIVGRLGTPQLAAVGACTVLYNFSNFVFNFLLYTTTPRIAAAASKSDMSAVSKIASQGLWVAITIGTITGISLAIACPVLFEMMGTSPEVMTYAVPFLRVRCLSSPAIMMTYVMSGVFRGFKDTRATLVSSTWSNIAHILLDAVCIFGLGMGAVGAAVATSLSLWLNWSILFSNIVKSGYLKVSDMATYPSIAEVTPMLRNGVLLSARSLLAMSTLMFATKMAAGLGAAGLAAHEIIRQIWVVSNQAFTSLDIATQSLVAFYKGKGDRQSAGRVFLRTNTLTVFVSVIIMGSLIAGRNALPQLFTQDPVVKTLVASVIPLIAIYMPMDGMASVFDGFLMGSERTGALSKVMACTSMMCALALVVQTLDCWPMTVTVLSVWVAIKILTLGRLFGNGYAVFRGKDSDVFFGGISFKNERREKGGDEREDDGEATAPAAPVFA